MTQRSMGSPPPVVDMRAWPVGIEATPGPEARAVAAALGAAASSEGIAYVVGHGIDPTTLDRARDRVAAFFDLPLETKARANCRDGLRGYRPLPTVRGAEDRKECFFCEAGIGSAAPAGSPLHGQNLWPEVEGFEPAMLTALDAFVALGQRIVRALDLHLGAAGALSGPFERSPGGGLRLLRYPAFDGDTGWLGANQHVDLPAFGLLHVGDVPGLEWRDRAGAWHVVEPRPDALVLQIGALLGRWTNDTFHPNPHRVALRADRPRDSMAFFFQPALDAEIRCIEGCASAAAPPRYPPVTFAKYLEEWVVGMAHESRRGALIDR